MAKITLLDHGYIQLVDHMGADVSVVRAARTSYDADWRAGEDEGSDTKLIRSMFRREHSTPFEAVTMTFEVYAPIFVFRQWHRHRTWSYNELSARYRELPAVFYVPQPEHVTSQSMTDRQMRTTEEIQNAEEVCLMIRQHSTEAFHRYQKLLNMGCARELARSVLPVNTYSHMFATVNLLNFFKFCKLRCDEHAQYEIRVFAEAALLLAQSVAPVCIEAFREIVLKRK